MCIVHTSHIAAINHQSVSVYTVSKKYVHTVKLILSNKKHICKYIIKMQYFLLL